MPVACVIYARISQDAQHTGLGVQRQLRDCRELAQALGWTVAGEYVDNDTSAFSGKPRPRYMAMLDRLGESDINGVLAWHTDRLHRSPVELERYIDLCEAHGVTTHTVKAGEIDLSTPSGRAVARTLGAWARYESEHKSERVRRKMLEIAQNGQRPGGPIPYGYRLVAGVPVVHEDEAAEIRGAYHAIVAGRSIGSIVKDLNDRGVKTARGGAWTSTSVRNLILRPANAGLGKYQGKALEGVRSVFPPIVSEDVWRAATGIVSDPSRRSRREDAVRHLLSGLARCGTCGAPLRISARAMSQRGDNGRFFYKCRQTGGGHSSQNAGPLEEYVSEVVVGVLSRPETLSALLANESPAVDVGALRAEADALHARLDEAAGAFAAGAITGGQLATITSAVRAKMDDVEAQISRAVTGAPAAEFAGPGARERWEAADVEGRRAVIDALVEVYVDPVRKAAPRVFDPGRVRFEWRA
ncbi:recombinase family protein [Kocuria sp. KH4]